MNHVTFRHAFRDAVDPAPNAILVAGCRPKLRVFLMWDSVAGEDGPGDDAQELCILKTRHTDPGVTALLVYKCFCGRNPCGWFLPPPDFEDPEDVIVLNWETVVNGTIPYDWLPPTFAIDQH